MILGSYTFGGIQCLVGQCSVDMDKLPGQFVQKLSVRCCYHTLTILLILVISNAASAQQEKTEETLDQQDKQIILDHLKDGAEEDEEPVSAEKEAEQGKLEQAEDEQEKRIILDNLKDGAESVTAPVLTGKEAEEGLFSAKLGSANIRISMLRGFEMTWDNSDFTTKFGGRIYLDIMHYFNDKNNLGDNGIGLRTIQLNMRGKLTKNWPYRFSLRGFSNGGKFDTSGVGLDDGYVRYLGFENVVLTMGQHTEPFSLEQQTSSLNIIFMERALPNAFAPGSTLGISAATGGKHWFATGGFFSTQLSEYKDQGAQGFGFTGYVAATPLLRPRGNIHVGSSYSYRKVGDGQDIFFRNRPESGITDVRYVNTGTIPGADEINRFGFDVVGIFGAWSIQSEYIHANIGRDSGFEDVDFSGWYTFISWFVTGETRNFLDKGIFGTITPLHKYGAFELALRFSSIDLSDKDITGGSEQNITFGFNWYIHKQLKLMFNYINVSTDAAANDDGTVEGNDSPHIIQMRLQAHF